MEINLEDSKKLGDLGEKASDILINMIEEKDNLSGEEMFFRYDLLMSVLGDIKKIFPPLFDAYMIMYHDAEKNGFSKEYYFGKNIYLK